MELARGSENVFYQLLVERTGAVFAIGFSFVGGLTNSDVMAFIGVASGLVTLAVTAYTKIGESRAERRKEEAEVREREELIDMLRGQLQEAKRDARWWRERYTSGGDRPRDEP